MKAQMLLFIAVLAVFAVTGLSKAQEPRKQVTPVAGTKVSLKPPDGFKPSTQFPGFWHPHLGSSIMVTEFSVPVSETSLPLFDSSQLRQKGMSLVTKQDVKVDDRQGFLLKVKQKALGIEFLKWLLIFGDEKDSVIIAAMFPATFESDLSEEMKASILSVTWDRKKNVSPTEGLNFTVEEKGELKLSRRMLNMLSFTKNGVSVSKNIDDPFFIVAQSFARTDALNHEEFAKVRLAQTATLQEFAIEQSNKVSFDGLNGYEIIASAQDKESGRPMVVYQVILFEDQNYFVMQGIVSYKNRQSNLEIFKEMASTFKRRKL